MPAAVLLDTGPLVAFLNENDAAHTWACEQFSALAGPFVACEAVLAEASHLLRKVPSAPSRVLAMLERGSIRIGMSLENDPAIFRPEARP